MRHLLSYAIAAATAYFSACAPDPTQLIVEIGADEDVKHSLQRVKVFAYSPNATDADKPSYQQLFSLASDSAARQTFPFSFGVERGHANAVRLVIAGYTSTAADAEPVIERKLLASFEDEKAVHVSVQLSSACYMRASQCTELDKTCTDTPVAAAAPGDCVPVELIAAGALSPKDDSSPAGPKLPTAPMCPSANSCDDAAYPCVASTSSGYTCQGQVAEWPMPDRQPGAKFQPSYDTKTIPGVVIDRVTGLYWQRELPERYDGCTGNIELDADSCSAAEAKAYCAQLKLADGQWRLPSKIELESLVDNTQARNTIDPEAFPANHKEEFWTSSPARADREHTWIVNFGNGFSANHSDDQFERVRCVRSLVTRNGTPADRFSVGQTTVTDHRTTLEWQKASVPANSWQVASDACSKQGESWRLPTLKELLTLIDPTQAGPAFPRSVFTVEADAMFEELDWASDDIVASLSSRAVLSVGLGATWGPLDIPASDSFVYRARCVR